MSRKSRARRWTPEGSTWTGWTCLGCGSRLHRELAPIANQAVHAVLPNAVVMHICGGCKTLHLEADDGTLRRPTPAEMFRIQMEHDQFLRRLANTTFPTCVTPAGTLILSPRETP